MGNCTKCIHPKGENRQRVHGYCSRYWYTAIFVGSTPAGSCRRPASTASTSDGCRRIKRHRIIALLPGSARDAAGVWWRSCSTNLFVNWREWGKQTTYPQAMYTVSAPVKSLSMTSISERSAPRFPYPHSHGRPVSSSNVDGDPTRESQSCFCM